MNMTITQARNRSWLWLLLGAALLPFTAMQTMLPIAGWLAPLLLLRFTRSQRVIIGVPTLAVAGSLAMGFGFRHMLDDMGGLPMMALVGSGYGLLLVTPPYLVDRLLAPRLAGLARTLVFPFTAVAVEFVVARYVPIYSSWGSRAYAHYGDLPLLQVISVTGIWGIAFLTCWSAAVANHVWELGWPRRSYGHPLVLFAGTLIAALLLGGMRVAFFPPADPTVRVAGLAPKRELVGDIDQIDWRTDAGRAAIRAAHAAQIDELFMRTGQEARSGAKIVAWSEGAAIVLDEDEAAFRARAATLARDEGIYLQVALVTLLQPDRIPAMENHALLFAPSGALLWDYTKSRPVPGGEASQLMPGPGIVPVVDTPYGRLATVICYDADFPDLVRQAGQARADILLVPASDWPVADEPHTQMATFRAIENGLTLIRPTNQGQMIAADYRGVELGRMNFFANPTPTLVVAAPTQGVPTIYARIGDSFAYLCVLGLAALAARVLARRATRIPVPQAPSPA